MKTRMTIDQYNKYKTGEIALREIRREHNKINNVVANIITDKSLIGIVRLELMFLVQVVVLIFMSNSELNDITVDIINKINDTDVKELMKSYIEIARIWLFNSRLYINNVGIYYL